MAQFFIIIDIMFNCKILYLFIFVAFLSCIYNSETVKIHKKRDNIIRVREMVKEIEIEDVIISRFARTYLIDKYLIISDTQSSEKVIYLFDRNTFNYVTSVGNRGLGPYEITRLMEVGINELDRVFYASDHGKRQIFRFELDSVVSNPNYIPKVHVKMDNLISPHDYLSVNDTLFIGSFWLKVDEGDYRPAVGEWNMITGEKMILNKYDHPKIERKRASFAMSKEYGIFVECYWHHDLMSICDLNGNLKYYVYGRKWDDRTQNSINFYRDVVFCKDKIVALFSDGELNFVEDVNGRIRSGDYPSKFIAFDLLGNYIHTLETGYQIQSFNYDIQNNRIIMVLDDEIQFAYLDLDGIL